MYIAFHHATFCLGFEDSLLAKRFSRIFNAKTMLLHPASHDTREYRVEVRGNAGAGYDVFFDGILVANRVEAGVAVYYITRAFGDAICMQPDPSVCVVHAASVCLSDGVVAFSGVSGSGKTSLSLMFSKYGIFAGDEYSFLNLETGLLWHEEHPCQLKADNSTILAGIVDEKKLLVEGAPFGKAYYVSLDETNYRIQLPDDRKKLRTLVFPHFEKNCIETEIYSLPASAMPETILQSFIGHDAPSILFRRVIRLIKSENIRLLSLRFSDSIAAAKKLYQHIGNEVG